MEEVLCSKCGLPIPEGEKYKPDNPICEGCAVGTKDEVK